MRGCICFEFNHVQPLHKGVTGSCATWNPPSLRPHVQRAFPRVRKSPLIFSESPLMWKSREIRDWPNVAEKKKHLAIGISQSWLNANC
jgi:hypothetical protein